MLMDTTIAEAQVPLLRDLPAASNSLAVPLRAGWVFGRLLLVGLLLTYLAGWVQDLQRVRRLEAEPTPPSKVITKHEAWQRVYHRHIRQNP